MRAYHRVDPLMDEKKSHYTPDQFGAFMKVQLVAGRQAQPGYFRSRTALEQALPSSYAQHIAFLWAENDLIEMPDGRVYVDGYTEWQEGDLTVAERMRRLRERKAQQKGNHAQKKPVRNAGRNGHRNAGRNASVTTDDSSSVTQPSHSAIRVGVGVSTDVGDSESSAAESESRASKRSTSRANGRQPDVRLTQRELESWSSFSTPEWSEFKHAWLGRGLHYAPFGQPDDDDTSQRGLLWQIADARPHDLARWVREAPGRTAREVIDHVLEQWHSVRADVGVDDPEWQEEKEAERRAARGAMTSIGDLIR